MGENFGLLRNLLPFCGAWAPGRPSKKPALYIPAAIYYNTLSDARRREDAWPSGRAPAGNEKQHSQIHRCPRRMSAGEKGTECDSPTGPLL